MYNVKHRNESYFFQIEYVEECPKSHAVIVRFVQSGFQQVLYVTLLKSLRTYYIL